MLIIYLFAGQDQEVPSKSTYLSVYFLSACSWSYHKLFAGYLLFAGLGIFLSN